MSIPPRTQEPGRGDTVIRGRRRPSADATVSIMAPLPQPRLPFDLPIALAEAITAFAALTYRYSRESLLTVTAACGEHAISLPFQIDDETTLFGIGEQLSELVNERPEAAALTDSVVTLTWVEGGRAEPAPGIASLTLSVRLRDWKVDLKTSHTEGLVARAHALAQLERHFLAFTTPHARAKRVAEVPIFSAEERRELLFAHARGASMPELTEPGLLHELFSERAIAQPDRLAVVFEGQQLTYRELDERAERLAEGLRAKGAGPGTFVAFVLPRCIDVYVAILGILKTGAAYVPLDPEHPRDRIEYTLEDCGAILILTHSSLTAKHGPLACTTIHLDEEWDEVLPATEVTGRRSHPTDVCYVIYTSGSTGKPKGVAVTHHSAVHLVRAEQALFDIHKSDRVFQGFSIAFDAAVEEVWLAFAAGATLVSAGKDKLLVDLPQYLTEQRVTVFSTVPTLLATLTADLPTVRILIVGGEACPPDLVGRFATSTRAMYNTYGPTEATVIATYTALIPGQAVTIGKPIPNYFIYILDTAGAPSPPGASGEICIGGIGLAKGYVGKPELTASRFIRNPLASDPGAPPLLYRTGDRGRFDLQGNIEFLGRLDDQVKLRGFRIELGEIESALMASGQLSQAVAMVREDAPGQQQLVAYVVPLAGQAPSEESLKEPLRQALPAYMQPTHIVTLDGLPTLTSGKVDKRSLPAPRGDVRRAAPSGVLPRTELERTIATIWSRLLGVPSVGVEDDFFRDLGGHSLLAAQMVSQLRRVPELTGLSILDVYQHPTIALITRHHAHDEFDDPTLVYVPKNKRVAVSPDAVARRHRICGIAQTVSLYFIYALFSAQWLAPYLTYGVLHKSGEDEVTSLLGGLLAIFALQPALLLLALAIKWTVLGRYKEGRYPLWGAYYFRAWFVEQVMAQTPTGYLAGTPLLNIYYRLLGAKIGRNVHFASDSIGAFDLVEIGDDAHVGLDVTLDASTIEHGMLVLRRIEIGARTSLGTRSVVCPGARVRDDASIGDLTLVRSGDVIPPREHWSGSPARRAAPVERLAPAPRPSAGRRIVQLLVTSLGALSMPAFTVIALVPALLMLHAASNEWGLWYLLLTPVAALSFVVLVALEIVVAKWLLVGRVRPGRHPIFGSFYLRTWLFDQAMGVSFEVIGGLFATVFLNPWYRLMGVRIGAGAEVSTAAALAPDLLEVREGVFLADAVSIGAPRFDGGQIELLPTVVGARTFVGNSAVIAGGVSLGDDDLLGALSVPPADPTVAATSGVSWFGSPAVSLPARQASTAYAVETTFAPPKRLVRARVAFEVFRVLLPTTLIILLTCLLVETTFFLGEELSLEAAIALFPFVFFGFAVLVSAIVVGIKWLLMGRYRPGDHPLWSPFVWRTELVTALQENLADPMLNELLLGTPLAPLFWRALGARIGARACLQTTCFTEYDLVRIGDDVCIESDATVQTHLFEDRVMKMSTIRIGHRCSIGQGSIVLYDTEMEEGSSLGALSLLMKGEVLPAASRWEGSPAAAGKVQSAET